MSLNFEEEKALRIHQHALDFHRQLVQAAVDYGLRALTTLFLLNGAAATAILASAKESLLPAALCFSIGAGLVVAALGVSYFVNDGFATLWNPARLTEVRAYDKIQSRTVWLLRLAMGLALISLAFFAAGLFKAAPHLWN
jgi:hypothetical protein